MKYAIFIMVIILGSFAHAQQDTTSKFKSNWKKFKTNVQEISVALKEDIESRVNNEQENKQIDKEKGDPSKKNKTKIKGIDKNNVEAIYAFPEAEYKTFKVNDRGEWDESKEYLTTISYEKIDDKGTKSLTLDIANSDQNGGRYTLINAVPASVTLTSFKINIKDTLYYNTHFVQVEKDAKYEYFIVTINKGIVVFRYEYARSLVYVRPKWFIGATPPDITALKDKLYEYRIIIKEEKAEAKDRIAQTMKDREEKSPYLFLMQGIAGLEGLENKKTGKVGLHNDANEIIIPAEYDKFKSVVNGHIIAVKNGLHGVIDRENKVIIPFKYSKLWKLEDDDYLCVRKGEKIGVMEYSGKIKLPIEYDELYLSETLSDGTTVVRSVEKNGKFGCLNSNYEFILDPIYDYITNVLDHDIVRVKKDNKYAFHRLVDGKMSKWYSKSSTYFRNGKVCIGTDSQIGFLSSTLKEELLMSREAYDWIYYNGGQYITTKKGGKQGIADYKGKEIIPNMYDDISTCSEGVVIMKIGDKEESKNGYYKLGYGFLTEVIYSYAAPFKNGTGVLNHSGARGKCDEKGRISWTKDLFTPPSSTRNQPYAQWKKNYTFGDNFPYHDKSESEDRVIIEGTMMIKRGAESAIIEILPNGTPGKILVPFTEDFLSWEGPSHFYRSGKLFITKTGEPVFGPKVTATVSVDCYLGNNCFVVEKNDKAAIYDLTLRKLVTKFEYDYIGMHNGGSLFARKGNQDYTLDHSGKVISSEEVYIASSSSSSSSSRNSSSSGNASVEVDVTYKGKSSDPSWLYVFYTKPDGSRGNGDVGLSGSKTFTVKPGTTLQYVLGSHGQGKKSTLVTAPNSGSKDYELNLR